MKLVTYRHRGAVSYGAISGDGIVELARSLGARYPDVRSLFAGGLPEAMALASRQAAEGRKADLSLADVELLPPIPNPGKLFCIGLNYEDHRKETKRDKTEAPAVFVRFPESQVGHGQPMRRPRESEKYDYEGEIAVVIGRAGRRIAEADAWAHVGGYSCFNDGSVRDWQNATTQWTAGKNFYESGAFGPWIVTADEIPAGTRMTLKTRLNGREMQSTDTSLMIHSIPRIIAHLSAWTRLEPGDVIASGTPGGVGSRREPPVWMKAGDVVEVEVGGVGVLRNPIADD
jgi:2-keto-4-pentenoate hydratase/2-oxohepta-3-ene-1,7-dioic acid hydratase in catechol pathway